MILQKKCKGHGKAKGAEACGKPTDVKRRKYGLCPSCYWDWMQNSEAGKIHYRKQFLPRSEKVLKKAKKKEEKEFRESLKSIQRLIQEARVPFQKWIRLRDANDGCISCGDVNAKVWHGGHYFKAELYTGLIFDEMNCNKQCEKCNTYLRGNESGYRLGLINKYGEESVLKLEELTNELRSYKFTREELKEIKKTYQEKLRFYTYENDS